MIYEVFAIKQALNKYYYPNLTVQSLIITLNKSKIDVYFYFKHNSKEEKILIKYFSKSRKVFVIGVIATIAVTILIALRRLNEPGYAVTASVLTLFIGLAVTALAARIAAVRSEDSMMCLLHIDLNPSAFIAKCLPIFKAMPKRSPRKCVYGLHLAEGYCALGDYGSALNTLDETHDSASMLSAGISRDVINAYVVRERARCAFLRGDAATGKEEADKLEGIAASIAAKKPAAANSLRQDARCYSTWASLLEGEKADMTEIESLMKKAPTKLSKIDLCVMLIIAAKNSGDTEAVERFSSLLSEQGGEIAIAKQFSKEGEQQ